MTSLQHTSFAMRKSRQSAICEQLSLESHERD